jgi:opacity protein-like surface antigen
MLRKQLIAGFFLGISLFAAASFVRANSTDDDKFRYPFYVGIASGYGSTIWSGLIPPPNKLSATLALSTPIEVTEGGTIWGFFAGYEIIPQFAVETSYTRYPLAKISFSTRSIFSFQNHGRVSFSTMTDSYSLVGKFMVIIPRTTVRVYSDAGVAAVHRADIDTPVNHWRASPTFGVGLNYNFSPRVMADLGANYTGGYGESELTPANDYVPFLYSVYLRLGYRF